MSEKNSVQVLIGGKVTRVSGYESEEYLERVASYLNHRIEELSRLNGWRRMTADTRSTLLALNVADDCFKARDRASELEEDLRKKDREIYDLKQELVSLQVMMDNMKKNGQKPGTPAGGGSRPGRDGRR